ncbi:MAG: hypothetical protein JXB32_14885 [Deltaproteobacteria bacterium]|nr:hypothetical protein [Deltaproteobacteria bacterium]
MDCGEYDRENDELQEKKDAAQALSDPQLAAHVRKEEANLARWEKDAADRMTRLAPRWVKAAWRRRAKDWQHCASKAWTRPTPPSLPPPATSQDGIHEGWRRARQAVMQPAQHPLQDRRRARAVQETEDGYWTSVQQLGEACSKVSMSNAAAKARFDRLRSKYSRYAKAAHAPVKGKGKPGRPRRTVNRVVLDEVDCLTRALKDAAIWLKNCQAPNGVGQGARTNMESDVQSKMKEQHVKLDGILNSWLLRHAKSPPSLVQQDDARLALEYEDAVESLGLTLSTGAKLNYLFDRIALPAVVPTVMATKWSTISISGWNSGHMNWYTARHGMSLSRRRGGRGFRVLASVSAHVLVAAMLDLTYDSVSRIVTATRQNTP